jgi:hypothetical protein
MALIPLYFDTVTNTYKKQLGNGRYEDVGFGTALPTETVATYAAMEASIEDDSTTKRDFFVSADETNGGVKSSYRYDGTSVTKVGGGSGSSTPTSGTVAIDDLTTIALVEKDIIDLTSANATETVDALSGGTANICYELRPEDGLELTITFTAAASAGAGDIVGPTADIVLDGSKGDYIKVIKRGSVYYQVDAMNYL